MQKNACLISHLFDFSDKKQLIHFASHYLSLKLIGFYF